MDKKDFDLMRHRAGIIRKRSEDLLSFLLISDIINTLERIWNTLTATETDITQHDEHGRVEL